MTPRTFFWAIAFSLPVTAAFAVSISLEHENAALQARISQLSASLFRHQASSRDTSREIETVRAQAAALKSEINRLAQTASPWQRRMLAIKAAWARLVAEGGSASTSGPSPLPIVQPSAKQIYLVQLLGDPTYAKAVSALMKQQVDIDFGRLLAGLNLSAEKQDAFEDLLAQRYMVPLQTNSVIGSAGTAAERTAVRAVSLHDIDADLRATVGSQVVKQFRAYNNNWQFYGTVDAMATRLSSTSTPLGAGQGDQVAGILSQAVGPASGLTRWTMPDSVIEQAQSILSAPQMEVLRQMQQEQQVAAATRASQQIPSQ